MLRNNDENLEAFHVIDISCFMLTKHSSTLYSFFVFNRTVIQVKHI